jgi:hypothetical protein
LDDCYNDLGGQGECVAHANGCMKASGELTREARADHGRRERRSILILVPELVAELFRRNLLPADARLDVELPREPFTGARAIGFGLIWLALLLYAADGLFRARTA